MGSNGNTLKAPLPMPCFASNSLRTQNDAVLAGLKAAKSIHVAQGRKFNTTGSSWPQPSKDRGGSHSPLSFAQHLYHSAQF